jgi:hypothetical protein
MTKKESLEDPLIGLFTKSTLIFAPGKRYFLLSLQY